MEAIRTLLVVTPFSSPNYAYPGAAYLARYLRRRGRDVAQADLNLETMLGLFSRSGLGRIFAAVGNHEDKLSPWGRRVYDQRARYLSTVDSVIRYLQGRDQSLAYRLCHPLFLPRGENFESCKGFDAYDGTGNTIAIHDRAKFVCTQYLYDLAGLIREGIFPYFQITLVDRFYDDFVHWCATFDRMAYELERPPNLVDQVLIAALDEHLYRYRPHLVGVSVPFARNLYFALRIARRVKEWNPEAKVVAGGGLFNTSMRHPSELRLFDYFDYLTLDDGERPLLDIVEHLEGLRDADQLKRTFFRESWRKGADNGPRESGAITYSNGCTAPDASHAEAGAPDYAGYRIDDYLSTLETNNVNQRVRCDGWWNKLTMAHGCYWKKCSFCDIHLSYIGDYDPAPAKNLVDKVEEAIAETGRTGFHFVDEALPPKVMREFALEVLRRDLHITWHSMLRFDKTFTPELCRLLAASGMVGAFGGLEVASNRLLELMKKGTTVEQVAVVCKNFQEAGIRTHAYLMYGFPSQTAQETIDALDVVRQLFKHGLVTSASWAKFGVTPHSPIGRNPAEYAIEILPVPENAFIEQILEHRDPANDHDRFTNGLQQAVRFYGLGFHHDLPSEGWFDFPVPMVSIDRDLMGKVLAERAAARAQVSASATAGRDRRVVWLGVPPTVRELPLVKKGAAAMAELRLHGAHGDSAIELPLAEARWLADVLTRARPADGGPLPLGEVEAAYGAVAPHTTPTPEDDGKRAFLELLSSPAWTTLAEHGLVLTDSLRWSGPDPSIRFLPLDGGPARAELVVQNGGPATAMEMPARWATWLAETLRQSRDGQPLEVVMRSFDEKVARARPTLAAPAPAVLAASPAWRTLLERDLAVL